MVDGEPQQPDPSSLSTKAIDRAVVAERDYTDAQLEVLRERLRGIDLATEVLNETVTRTPTEIQKEVGHLRELTEEQLRSIQVQFKERDTRQERESKDNKVAVDAAFAAQKEAAAKQDEANAKAIDKSEKATAETIKTNQELATAKTDALTKALDELKSKVNQIEFTRLGNAEAANGRRQDSTLLVGIGALIVSIIVAAVIVYAAAHK